ncbi:MAG: alpha/beta hydrolase [Actinomycetota bacterium]
MRGSRCAAICVAITFLFPAIAIAAPQSGKAFIPPVDGEITKPFKMLKNSFGPGSHRGVDFGVPSETPVKASGAGEVTFVGPVGGEGLFITISHEKGLETTYSYLSSTDVVNGQRVAQGDVIGKSGEGHPGEGAPALHFGAKQDGKYIDPEMLFQDFSDITELIQMMQVQEQSSGSSRLAPGSSNGPASSRGPGGQGGSGGPGRPTGMDDGLKAPAAVFGSNVDLGPPSKVGVGPAVVAPPGSWKGPDAVNPGSASKSGRGPTRQSDAIQPALDSAARDKANRIALQKELAETSRQRDGVMSELERLLGNPPVKGRVKPTSANEAKRLYQELAVLNKRYAGAKKLWDQLEAVAEDGNDGLESDQVYLLDFDTDFANGDGKAIVALGNPDTSKHVGIVVPGLGSRLDYIDGPISNAANLRKTIHDRLGPAASSETSAIMWLGYDAPETIADAQDSLEAVAGAAALKEFVRELRWTYKGLEELGAVGRYERQHITVIGHSYGSSVTGFAGTRGIDAQDLALLASPGSGGTDAGDLGAPARRIWAARNEADVIKGAIGFAALGDDPTNRNFGAVRIPMDDSQQGHAADAYYRMRSTGLLNLARITSGHADEVAAGGTD